MRGNGGAAERHVKINDSASVATYDFNGKQTGVIEQPLSQLDGDSEINERIDTYSDAQNENR